MGVRGVIGLTAAHITDSVHCGGVVRQAGRSATARMVQKGGERAVASIEAVRQAVRAAVDSAHVDRNAPEGERVRFDREALSRVTALYKAPDTQDQVIQAWRAVLRAVLDDQDIDKGLASVVLQDRLKGVRDVSYDLVDGVWKRRPENEVRAEDDPWLAERNW